MQPISLSEMDGVALQNRTDTKFIFGIEKLGPLLEKLAPNYRVLEVAGVRLCQYRSVYLDTENLNFYFDHHNGRKNRVKIRYREYLDTGISFLEIKRKNNKGRTDKKRIQIPAITTGIRPAEKKFISESIGHDWALNQALTNSFLRITLVHKTLPERFTIDTRIAFTNGNVEQKLENVVVAELKQAKASRNSESSQVLKQLGIRPHSISKYCMGTILLNPGIKQNNFKENQRLIAHL